MTTATIATTTTLPRPGTLRRGFANLERACHGSINPETLSALGEMSAVSIARTYGPEAAAEYVEFMTQARRMFAPA